MMEATSPMLESSTACISEDEAVALVQGVLAVADAERVRTHAEECTACRAVVAGLARMGTIRRDAVVDSTVATVAESGTRVPVVASLPGEQVAGRYLLGEVIGAGAMGIVYSARDTTLSRMVALKRVRTASTARGAGADPHERLVHEARTMAQLSHPMIVAVFDAGVADGAAYVAMEHVDGDTLRSWLLTKKRGRREIAGAFAQAAHGLAAAHAAGIVHGDFKPDNVLVDRAGRVRVADFGLARFVTPEALATVRGLAGTLAYMAPEQLAGQPADTASDQYAFCVSLFEAVHGVRPADARPTTGRVPGWLSRIYERGLDPVPANRYPSMDVIASALDLGERRTTMWRWGAAATLATAAVVGIAAAGAMKDEPEACPLSARPATAWGPDRREAVHRAFQATKLPYAEQAFTAVERSLERYANTWSAASQDACKATHVQRTQSEPMLDLRTACLEQRLHGFESLIGVLSSADAKVVENAVKASVGLDGVASCADLDALLEPLSLPGDPAVRATVQRVREQVAEAKALRSAGKVTDARAVASSAATAAAQTKYRPVEAEALVWRGALEEMTGDFETAEKTLNDAVLAGQAGNHPGIVAQAFNAQISVLVRRGRYDDAHAAARHAFALLEARPRDAESLASALNNTGTVFMTQNKPAEALDHYLRALAIYERLYGPDDVRLAKPLHNLAGLHGRRGEVAEATGYQRRALAILEKVHGPHHPDLAHSLGTMGNVLLISGDHTGGLAAFQRAAAIQEAAFGPTHPELARTLNNLGHAHSQLGNFDQAQVALERSLAIREKALGPDHPDVARTLNTLGLIHENQAQFAQALVAYRRSLPILEAKLAPNAPEIGAALTGLGHAELGTRTGDLGIRSFERALIALKTGAPTDRARTQFFLARARWEARKDRTQAIEIAREALATYEAAARAADAPTIAEIRTWIAKRAR